MERTDEPHPGRREATERLHSPAKVAEPLLQGQRQAIEAIAASAEIPLKAQLESKTGWSKRDYES